MPTVLGQPLWGNTALPSQYSSHTLSVGPQEHIIALCVPTGLWTKNHSKSREGSAMADNSQRCHRVGVRTADNTKVGRPCFRGPCLLFVAWWGWFTSGQMPWWEASDCEHKGLAVGSCIWGILLTSLVQRRALTQFLWGLSWQRNRPLGKPHRTQRVIESGKVLWRSPCAPLAQAGPPRTSFPGPRTEPFRVCARKETPQILWATCA